METQYRSTTIAGGLILPRGSDPFIVTLRTDRPRRRIRHKLPTNGPERRLRPGRVTLVTIPGQHGGRLTLK
jgi:hypothetical protein